MAPAGVPRRPLASLAARPRSRSRYQLLGPAAARPGAAEKGSDHDGITGSRGRPGRSATWRSWAEWLRWQVGEGRRRPCALSGSRLTRARALRRRPFHAVDQAQRQGSHVVRGRSGRSRRPPWAGTRRPRRRRRRRRRSGATAGGRAIGVDERHPTAASWTRQSTLRPG